MSDTSPRSHASDVLFPVESVFPTPSMIISPEEKALYNITAALSLALDGQERLEQICAQLAEQVSELTKLLAKKTASPSAAKKG